MTAPDWGRLVAAAADALEAYAADLRKPDDEDHPEGNNTAHTERADVDPYKDRELDANDRPQYSTGISMKWNPPNV